MSREDRGFVWEHCVTTQTGTRNKHIWPSKWWWCAKDIEESERKTEREKERRQNGVKRMTGKDERDRKRDTDKHFRRNEGKEKTRGRLEPCNHYVTCTPLELKRTLPECHVEPWHTLLCYTTSLPLASIPWFMVKSMHAYTHRHTHTHTFKETKIHTQTDSKNKQMTHRHYRNKGSTYRISCSVKWVMLFQQTSSSFNASRPWPILLLILFHYNSALQSLVPHTRQHTHWQTYTRTCCTHKQRHTRVSH